MPADRLAQALAILKSGVIPVPPAEQIFVGDGDYLNISSEFLGYFVELGRLLPSDIVLDIGCGIGRMAAGLACYLDGQAGGAYIGFDPVCEGIEWCRENVTASFPHCSFHWVDFHNSHYNPEGRIRVGDYRFPMAAASIDFAILTSVLTHLPAVDVEAYLIELSRLLKPDGRMLATAYLFDGPAPPRLPHMPFIDFSIADPDHPGQWHVAGYPPMAAVAFSEAEFARMVARRTGRTPSIMKGRWQGGAGPWFQDLVLA